MNTAKCMFLIGLGIGGTLAYQRYGRCAMKELEKVVDMTMKKANEGLEEMM